MIVNCFFKIYQRQRDTPNIISTSNPPEFKLLLTLKYIFDQSNSSIKAFITSESTVL
jgi:hypothetical protein